MGLIISQVKQIMKTLYDEDLNIDIHIYTHRHAYLCTDIHKEDDYNVKTHLQNAVIKNHWSELRQISTKYI